MTAQAQECIFEGLLLPPLATPQDGVAQLCLAQEAAQVRTGGPHPTSVVAARAGGPGPRVPAGVRGTMAVSPVGLVSGARQDPSALSPCPWGNTEQSGNWGQTPELGSARAVGQVGARPQGGEGQGLRLLGSSRSPR